MIAILRMCLLVTICCLCVLAQARTLTIGIDLSASNPLLTSPPFAAQAARYAVATINGLKEGDVVRVRSFGARDDVNNLPVRAVTISRRNRAPEVARAVGAYLNSLPGQAGKSQGSTNIVAFLELGSDFGCADGGTVLLITDGIESSSVVSAKALLEGRTGLPIPEPVLRGCSLTFYGMGAGWELAHVKRLQSAWSRWAQKAGAEFVSVAP